MGKLPISTLEPVNIEQNVNIEYLITAKISLTSKYMLLFFFGLGLMLNLKLASGFPVLKCLFGFLIC